MFRPENESEVNIKPKDEPENELAGLRARFCLALLERVETGLPNVLRIKGRYYYVLSRSVQSVEPLKTTEQLRCLRDDFQLFDLTRTLTVVPNAGAMIDYTFAKVDPASAGLTGDEAGRLVKRIIEGRD